MGNFSYLLWNKSHNGNCEFTNVINGQRSTASRCLSEFEVFVRYNSALSIIEKVQNVDFGPLSDIVFSRNQYNLDSSVRGEVFPTSDNNIKVYSSKGVGYLSINDFNSKSDSWQNYKVFMGKVLSGHIGETDANGQVKVLSTVFHACPNEVCTDSYLVIGNFKNRNEALNTEKYFKTKFLRFLLLQSLVSMNISKGNFRFVPLLDFSNSSDIDWTLSVADIDQQLYRKYNLSNAEIEYIEKMIKPMD